MQGVQTFPRPVDLQEVTEPKPLPPAAIADDPQAEASYNRDLELWGMDLRNAGVRICNWAKERGMKLEFACDRAAPK